MQGSLPPSPALARRESGPSTKELIEPESAEGTRGTMIGTPLDHAADVEKRILRG
jgi:hypothetical protein